MLIYDKWLRARFDHLTVYFGETGCQAIVKSEEPKKGMDGSYSIRAFEIGCKGMTREEAEALAERLWEGREGSLTELPLM